MVEQLEKSEFRNNHYNTINSPNTHEMSYEEVSLRERRTDDNTNSENRLKNLEDTTNFTIISLFLFTKKLVKVDKEFLIILIYILLWTITMFIEFCYGISILQVDIISDSFFHLFKTSAFLITALSILLSKYCNFFRNFLSNRIELISALANVVFLMIVSLYMILQSLHILSEKDEYLHENKKEASDNETNLINFFQTFGVVKIMLDTSFLLFFNDYIIHPSLQIKLILWKKYRAWKKFEELEMEDLKENNHFIRMWDNHFENMNSLSMNVLCDLIANAVFLLSFHFSSQEHFEYIYFFVCSINSVLAFILVIPLMSSILQILMQGKSKLFQCFFNKIDKDIRYYEGVLGIQQIKFWMVAQNEIKCYLKVLVNSSLDKTKFKEDIDQIASGLSVNFDITINTIINS